MDVFWDEPDNFGASVKYYEMRIRGGVFRNFEDCAPIFLEKKQCQIRAKERRIVQANRVAIMFESEKARHEAELCKVDVICCATTFRF